MSATSAALIPLLGVIFIGWLLRRTQLVPSELWSGVAKLSYQALLPATLFSTISLADFDGMQAGSFALAAAIAFGLMGAIALLFKPLPVDGPGYTSLFQGAVRWNGFLLLAFAQAAFGLEGAALLALVFAPTIPIINIMCVTVLSLWGDNNASPKLTPVIGRIVTNPLILACFAGITANAFDLFQTGPIADMASLIGRAALPLILLTVGAGLDFSALRARPGLLSLSVSLKLIVAPLVFYGCGRALGVEGLAMTLLVAVGSAPGAAAAYVLASEMGGDKRLMAGHVTATTVLTFIALPFWIWFASQ
jgi:predicted permease